MPKRLLPVLCLLLMASCARTPAPEAEPAAADVGAARLADLEQQVATLRRSDTISRDANRKLQEDLAAKDDELASLRADLAFYERFLGESGPRRGLSVHEFIVQTQDPPVWHFTAALSQTTTRDRENRGSLTVAVEGTQDGRMRTLDWSQLRQEPKAAALPYRLRYLQRLEGDLILPQGFKPVRVLVRLQPAGGKALEQSFPWAEAVRG